MGHKKRNLATRSKSSSPAAVAPVSGGNNDSTPAVAEGGNFSSTSPRSAEPNTAAVIVAESESSPDYSTIRLDSERALNALRRANHTKALRLIKDASHKYYNSALIHRVKGAICAKVAGIIHDPNAKSRHLKNAIESARKAVDLSPNSIEFAHFYANLLFDVATDGKEYEEVVQECERALAIENPIDPAKERLQDEQQSNSTPDMRIGQMQQELRSLVQKSNIASLSTWMKNFGNGEEKFRLIPIRRLSEDPMEVRCVQTRRPNEIQKATKTPDQRRREIEVRVAAARLMQQKSDKLFQGQAGQSKRNELNSAGSLRLGERRKHGYTRKNASCAERKDQLRSFWNSMTYERKKKLLKIRVSDIRMYFSLSKDILPHKIISEALSFAEVNKKWQFWYCFRCHEKFVDAETYLQHVVQEHLGRLSPKLQSVLPQDVEHDWAEMLLNCSWKPLDLDSSVRVLEQRVNSEDPKRGDRVYKENHKEESKDNWTDSYCSQDMWESYPDTEIVDSSAPREDGKAMKMECNEYDPSLGSESYALPNSWPLSDDSERAKLLKRIGSVFKLLTSHKYLAASHLHKVIKFTMDELHGLPPCSRILKAGLDQSPLCICFLGAPQLQNILKFLQEVSHSSGGGSYPEKGGPSDANIGAQVMEPEEKLVLSDDVSCLILDENLLPTEAGGNDVCLSTSAAVGSEKVSELNSDFFLSWIFGSSSSAEHMAIWSRIRDEKSQQGLELLRMLEKEFSHLQSLCDRKYEHLGYEEALQGLEELCLDESKKRNNAGDFTDHGFDSVLRRLRDELVDNQNELMMACNRLELEAISNVLKEAENININQFGYVDGYGGVNSHLRDLEAAEEDSKSEDYPHQVDTCIELAIQTQKEQLEIELSKLDARIMRNRAAMKQLEIKLDPVSKLDYRSILLPLVKSFMRAHLEDLAEKDATEKSDAAREAFLAELALDSKKGNGKGNDNFKHMPKKTKDKKRSKDSRKPNLKQAGSFNKQTEITNKVSSATTYEDDNADSGTTVSESNADLEDMEEEFQRTIELEAEERKLEETLEYQRKIEYVAKQKHLAQQSKRSASFEHMSEGLVSSSTLPKLSKDLLNNQEWQPVNNGFANDLEGFQRSTVDEDTGPNTYSDIDLKSVRSSALSHPMKVRPGLSNGDIASHDSVPYDRRTGRRGRRKNSSKLSEEKNQTVSTGENAKIGLSQAHDWDCVSAGDVGPRTLRQYHVEEDDEERFQADLEKAVRQSLGTFQSPQPFVSNSRVVRKSLMEVESLGSSVEHMKSERVGAYGTGLHNKVGEYNCFLNVIIQSLWHLKHFREEFLRRSTSEHLHVGDPCVVCALYDILTALNMASTDDKREAVAPTSLRTALSNYYPESNFFQEGQMNDASEVLYMIFKCLHQSFTSSTGVSDATGDCSNPACIAHSIFGMNIFELMNCSNCRLESRHMKYNSFFHNVNASALRTMKAISADSSFDELMNLVEMKHQLPCNSESDGRAGCGKLNHIHHILTKLPGVFTTVLGWQKTCESRDDIRKTLAALATEIDISVLYRVLDPKRVHHLVSVVCYYGQHYHCFAYSHDHERWIMFDDKTVKVVGTWAEVLTLCEKGHLQPQVLFYEAADS